MPFVSRRLWSARIPFETIVKICENTVWEGEEGKFSFGSYASCHTLKSDIRCLKCTKNDAKEEREKIGMSLLKMPFFTIEKVVYTTKKSNFQVKETRVKICENTVWEEEEGKFSFGSYASCHTLKSDIRYLKCTKNDAKEEREKIGMSLLKMPFFHERKSRLHDEEIEFPSKIH